jgi:hypothetical protein
VREGCSGAAELWPQEQQLCATATEGVLLDLRSHRPGEDDPTRGRQWIPERRIRARVLFQLLTGCGPGLADGVVAVRVRGARIVGRLNLGGWKLRCPLELYQCYLHCRLDLAKAEAPNISLRGSYLRSRLSARRLRVIHTLNLTGFRCNGGIALGEAHISGQLDCAKAVFSNPDGRALTAFGLSVDADMSLGKTQCTGKVQLANAHIGGMLDCTDAVFCNPQGLAVDLELASVVQAVVMRPAVFHGGLDLHRAQVGAWYDERRIWPEQLRLEGFVYDSIDAPDATVKDRVRSWLPRTGYLPQPYEQLAGVYRREGNEQAARMVAIGKQRARRAHVQGWTRWPSRAWSVFLRCTIGCGHRPMLALIWLAVLVILGSLVFAAGHPDLLRPAKPGSPEQPGFNSFRYTVDLLLPVANFKQRDSFVASGWVVWVSFGFTFAGWLLAAVVVAGMSGVFKRD